MNGKLCVHAGVLILFVIAGCNSNTPRAADEHAANVNDATSPIADGGALLPGAKPGSMPEGCYLRATIDGKKWEAKEMNPDEMKLSLVTVNGKNGNSSITFVTGRSRDSIGQPHDLGDSNQITYWGGEGFFVGAKSGQFTVTKIEEPYIEGTFNFTAEKDGRKVEATDGEFRILAPPPAPSN
jgi:hypothetical protein